MVKEVTTCRYYCDICGKEILATVYSPIWGELNVNGDGNYNRDGDIIGIDICGMCKTKAEHQIVSFFNNFSKEEVKKTENDDSAPKNDKKKKKSTKKATKRTNLDIGKIMALHNAGWSYTAIADELGTSTSTICRIVKEQKEGNHEDND